MSILLLFSAKFPVLVWFFLCLSSQQFEYNVRECRIFLLYLVWGSVSFLNLYVYVFHQILEVFIHYFFRCFFWILIFLLLEFWWHANKTFWNCFMVPDHFSILIFFSLLFRWDNIYSSIIECTEFLLCHVHSAIEPSSEFLILVIVFDSSNISMWSFIPSLSLMILSILTLFQEYLWLLVQAFL